MQEDRKVQLISSTMDTEERDRYQDLFQEDAEVIEEISPPVKPEDRLIILTATSSLCALGLSREILKASERHTSITERCFCLKAIVLSIGHDPADLYVLAMCSRRRLPLSPPVITSALGLQ